MGPPCHYSCNYTHIVSPFLLSFPLKTATMAPKKAASPSKSKKVTKGTLVKAYHFVCIEKKPRAPSAYNIFMKTEVSKVKAENPKLDHKEAFKVAAANVRPNRPLSNHAFGRFVVEKVSPKQKQVIGALSRLSVLIGCLSLSPYKHTFEKIKKRLLFTTPYPNFSSSTH